MNHKNKTHKETVQDCTVVPFYVVLELLLFDTQKQGEVLHK